MHDRRASRLDIERRAGQSGYRPDYAAGRLGYGSFVSLRHRYVYVETPKAACTSIKRMLVELEDASFDRDAPPYHRETRLDMLIHQRKSIDIPSLLDVPAEAREEILSGTGQWFVFTVSRNPFSRLVSVFENKIRLGEPRYRDLEARYGDRGPFTDPKSAFAAFIAEVIGDRDRREADPHFISQSQLLMPQMIPYTRMFKLEQIGEMSAALRKHLADNGTDNPVVLSNENASLAKPWRDYYDAESARVVAEAYAEDFKTFGYDPEDWRGGAQTVADTEADRRWRAQIVERNAFIDRMFDWMDELRED